MPDIEPIKARVVIEYDGSGLEKAKEDLQSLGEASGGVGESVSGAGESLAALDEQLGKSATGTRSFNEALTGLPKVVESGGTAIVGFTDAMQEHQAVIEDTAQAITDMQEPLINYDAAMEHLSTTVSSPHFAENMSVFHDALVNPEPYQLVQGYLQETGQSWSDFASSIGSDNMSILKSNREFLSDLRSSGGSIFEMYGGEAVKAVTTDLGAFASQMDTVNSVAGETNKTLAETNKFGGLGKALYGPELPPGGVGEIAGLGDIFGGATEGMMGMLDSIAMPLMAAQMVGMMAQQVGQGIYDMAAVAEGPAAHSMGTFTGTIDALGQSMQHTAAQFSEGIGQGILPTLNAMNYQAGQGGDFWGGFGNFLGGLGSTVANLWQLGTGANPVGGIEGLVNQGAAFFGMQQPFQGPGPSSQYQQQMSQIPQTVRQTTQQLQYQSSLTLAEVVDPNYLAAQDQALASQQAAQYLIQSYNHSHPISQADLIQQARFDAFAAQQEQNVQWQMANNPTYGQVVAGDINAGNFGKAWQDFTQGAGSTWAQEWQSQGGAFNSIGDFFAAWGNNFWHGGEAPYSVAPKSGGGSIFDSFSDWWNGLFGGGGGTSGAGFTGCFIAGTRVLMADGTEKPIEQVQVGDCVLAHDGLDDVVATVQARIIPPPKMVYTLVFSDGNTLTLTDSHPIATPLQGWKSLSPEAAKQENPDLPVHPLRVGDSVCTIYGTCTLVSVHPREVTQVYNITVNEPHTFYANKVLVHNKTTGGQISEQVSGIQLPTIDLSGIASQLASAFGGIQVPHLDLSGLTAGLASAFTGISLPPIPDIGSQLSGALSGMFAGISLPAIPDIGSMLSGALSGMFGGISLPAIPDIGSMLSGAMSGMFGGIALPSVPDLGGMLSGAMSGMFGGISLPSVPDVGGMINGALSTLFSGISLPAVPGFASGIEGFSGGAAFIAESGPELVTLPQGASVYPLSTGAGVGGNMTPISLGGGGGSTPQSMNLTLQIGSETIISAIGMPLAQNMRLTAGLRGY